MPGLVNVTSKPAQQTQLVQNTVTFSADTDVKKNDNESSSHVLRLLCVSYLSYPQTQKEGSHNNNNVETTTELVDCFGDSNKCWTVKRK